MRRAIEVAPKGAWPTRRRIGHATLPFDYRHRRRITLTADDGRDFLLDLPEARIVHDGDGLVLEDGGVIEVRAGDEEVIDVACEDPVQLARIAWHLGNRHLAVEITATGLRLRDDHVIAGMLEGLGARVTRRRAPFTPEAGAYAHEH
jgi:urease accessory protein